MGKVIVWCNNCRNVIAIEDNNKDNKEMENKYITCDKCHRKTEEKKKKDS